MWGTRRPALGPIEAWRVDGGSIEQPRAWRGDSHGGGCTPIAPGGVGQALTEDDALWGAHNTLVFAEWEGLWAGQGGSLLAAACPSWASRRAGQATWRRQGVGRHTKHASPVDLGEEPHLACCSHALRQLGKSPDTGSASRPLGKRATDTHRGGGAAGAGAPPSPGPGESSSLQSSMILDTPHDGEPLPPPGTAPWWVLTALPHSPWSLRGSSQAAPCVF